MQLVSLDDYERQAHELLPKNSLDYYKSGAGDELTLKWNRSSFAKFRIRPRFLRDVTVRDPSCIVLNSRLSFPCGISPTAMQKMAHPDGELANARAAANANVLFIMSTLSTTKMEDIAAATPNSEKWFQLYIYNDRELTKSIIRRVEKCGFKALVLTVDAPLFGLRRADVRNKFTLPPHLTLANFADVVESQGGSGINEYVAKQFDPSISWEDVNWLMNFSKLPVILKGILTAEDARIAVDIGVAGIIVSNHGARQLDGVPSSIEALPEIVAEVKDKVPVMLDGGIRQGTDIFMALALGAKMVFVGRPALYGLACGGQSGVENIINILKKEFDLTLCNSGVRRIEEISKEMVVHENYYAKL
ncbi:unnamed protein product [Diamesa hyperborea]